tara:strand:- start:90 stop:359 length:270 start_codon:yes stop_codon:yes gene_type:complete
MEARLDSLVEAISTNNKKLDVIIQLLHDNNSSNQIMTELVSHLYEIKIHGLPSFLKEINQWKEYEMTQLRTKTPSSNSSISPQLKTGDM